MVFVRQGRLQLVFNMSMFPKSIWVLFHIFAIVFMELILASAPIKPAMATAVKNYDNVMARAEFESDNITYNQTGEIITIFGDVVVKYDGKRLLADKLIYRKPEARIYAEGNIVYYNENGDVAFAQKADFNDKIEDGFVEKISIKFNNEAEVIADNMEKQGEIYHFSDAEYIPCKCKVRKISADGSVFFDTREYWKIKATDMKIDKEKEMVRYKNAQVRFLDIPVFYTPYFFHPVRGSKRKTGFLTPSIGNSSHLGAFLETPFYINIKPQMDATLTPIFSTEEEPVLKGKFRHLTQMGSYTIESSITNPQERDDNGNKTNGKDIRWHLRAKGDFQYDDEVTFGFDSTHTSDDTYLSLYDFDGETLITSKAYIEKLQANEFLGAEILHFDDNSASKASKAPFILPFIRHENRFNNKDFEFLPDGSVIYFDNNLLRISRDANQDVNRVSMLLGYQQDVKKDLLFLPANLFRFKTELRQDFYVTHNEDEDSNTTMEDGFAKRFIPLASLEWENPMVKNFTDDGYLFIKPRVKMVVTPKNLNKGDIPNEDSENFSITHINLFQDSHFEGQDIIEEGLRVDYGLEGFYRNQKLKIGFLFGQNYAEERPEHNKIITDKGSAGLEDDFSDYVGNVKVSYNNITDVNYSFRLDNKDMQINYSEVGASLKLWKLKLSADYMFLFGEEKSEELVASASYDFLDNATITGGFTRNLARDDWIKTNIGLSYSSCCYNAGLKISQKFFNDRDIEPSTSYMFHIGFENFFNIGYE